MMRRTQVYLDDELTRDLDRLARQKGTTRAAILRQAARQMLEREQVAGRDPIFDIVGIGWSNNPSISEDHDAVLAEIEVASWQE